MLPQSQTVLDRATIQRHLLNEANDPYTRSPLTIGECSNRLDLYLPL